MKCVDISYTDCVFLWLDSDKKIPKNHGTFIFSKPIRQIIAQIGDGF